MGNQTLIEVGTLVGSRKSVQFDVPTLLETGLVIQAQSGGGKSHAIRRILELTHPLVQQAVLDLEGEFPTLREIYDYIIAGKGGDIGLTVGQKMPQLLAIKLLELRASAIMDLYELKSHDRIRFVRLFLEAVMDAPKSLYHSVLFVLDESHHFAPQVGEAESYAAVIDLCARGRKRGFRPILATQRISKLHKDACAELGNKMIGRTGLDIDQKRAADELDMGKAERLNLRNLKPGEFHVYGPALRVDGKSESGIVLCQVGPVKSRHPKAGSRQLEAPPEASSAIKKIVFSLANLPAEAETKAKTEEDLRRENADLKRKLTLSERAPATPSKPDTRELERLRAEVDRVKSIYQQEHAETATRLTEIEAAMLEVEGKRNQLNDTIRTLNQLIGRAHVRVSAPARKDMAVSDAPIKVAVPSPAERVMRTTGPVKVTQPTEGLSTSQQVLLNALAAFEVIGMTHVNKVTLAAMARCSPTSGGYFNNLGRLRSLGFVEYPNGGIVCLTAEGRKTARHDVPLESLNQYHGYWLGMLSTSQQAILSALLEKYPRSVKKDHLAESLGVSPTSGGYFNNLGRLRTLGAIEYPAPGEAKASSLLFPEGLV